MTTANDTKFRALATKLIGKYGKQVRWTRVGDPTYDPATSETVSIEHSSWVRAALSNYSPGDVFRSEGVIREGDKRLLIAGASSLPKAGDRFLVNNHEWAAVGVEETWSGDDVAVIAVHVRR